MVGRAARCCAESRGAVSAGTHAAGHDAFDVTLKAGNQVMKRDDPPTAAKPDKPAPSLADRFEPHLP
jgi:hypothetical protein